MQGYRFYCTISGTFEPKSALILKIAYIDEKYPELHDLYDSIYRKKNMQYWEDVSKEIDQYCQAEGIAYTNFFYHSKLVAEKKKQEKMKTRQ